jgi:hypothetical protein
MCCCDKYTKLFGAQPLVYNDIWLVACSSAASVDLWYRIIELHASLLYLCYACRWVPVAERSRSLSLVYSGWIFIGSICGLAQT